MAAALMLAATAPDATAAGPPPTYGADSVQRTEGPPPAVTVPPDGRVNGDGFTASIDGVATTTGTRSIHLVAGQRMWAFSLTVRAVSEPPFGPKVGELTGAVTANGVTLPLPITQADVGHPIWFAASLPTGSGDVDVNLTAAGTTTGFSLAHMARTPGQPTTLYRTPGSWETPTTGTDAAVTTTFTSSSTGATSPFNVPIRIDAGELTAFAPDTAGHLPPAPDQAWLALSLSSEPAHPSYATTSTFLRLQQHLPASAVTLTLPGGAPVPATAAPAPTADEADGPIDLFGAIDFWPVPADTTTATLTVTLPASVPATPDYSGDHGTATFSTSTVTIPITVAAATQPTPPATSGTTPAVIPDIAPAKVAGAATASAPVHHGGANVLPWLLALAVAAAGVVLLLRRLDPPTPAPAGTAWTAPPTPAPSGWGHAAHSASPTTAPPVDQPVTPQPVTPQPNAAQPTTPPPSAPTAGTAPPPPPAPLFTPPAPAALAAPALRVLGHIQLEGFAQPVTNPALRALLAYYALHAERPVSPDTVRARLAGNGAEISGPTLNNYNSKLRSHLPDGATLTGRGNGLQLTGVTTDLAVLQSALGRSPTDPGVLAAALALVTGPPFDEADWPWVDLENLRSTAERLVVTAATRLAATTTDADLALWGWHRALLADPVDDAAAAGTVDAAAATGRSGAADAEWRARTRTLQALGMEPGPALRAAYERHLASPDSGPE